MYNEASKKDLEKRNAEIKSNQPTIPTTSEQLKGFLKPKSKPDETSNKKVLRYESIRVYFYKLWQQRVFGRNNNSPLVITKHNARLVKHILQWMTNLEYDNSYSGNNETPCDWEDCNCEKLDVTKGLYIWGQHSRGKTAFAKALVQLMNQAHKEGFTHIPKVHSYSYKTIHTNSKRDGNSKKQYSHPESIFMDDLAWRGEANLNLYGNEENLVSDIIQYRLERLIVCRRDYMYRTEKVHGISIFTSNFSPSKIKEIYKTGVYDRLIEMCNIVHWDGDDSLRLPK
ncbi:MAG: hypothetical protein AAF969_10275 [Bacteroidota bacterium]